MKYPKKNTRYFECKKYQVVAQVPHKNLTRNIVVQVSNQVRCPKPQKYVHRLSKSGDNSEWFFQP